MKVSSRLLSAIAMIVGVALCTLSAPVASAADGGIGGRPANPDPANPRTKSIFIYSLKATEEKKDAVLVMNNTSKEQVISLYAVDGILTNTGAYTCKQASEQKSDLGSWVTFSQPQITLPANTSREVPFTVTVPGQVDVGEHNGCIVFESASDEGDVQGNVRIRTRQAIRMAVTLPGDLKKEIFIDTFTVEPINGFKQFLLTVSNKGNVSADVNTKVLLKTLWGSTVYMNEGGYPVLANTSLQLSFVNEAWPFWGGWYKASSEITYDSRPGVYNVKGSEHLVTKKSSPLTVFVAPAPLAVVAYLVTLGALAASVVWMVRRYRENQRVAVWTERKVKKGETLTELAAHYNVNWRTIARANKLKVPYVLTEGDSLKLPAESAEPADQSKKVAKKRKPTKKG